MNIKVRGGTTIGGTNLCLSCRQATVIKGFGPEFLIRCGDIGEMIRFPVAECTEYQDRAKTTVNNMKEVAWILVPKKGDGCGFVKPDTFVKMHKEEDDAAQDTRFSKAGRWIDEDEV